MIVSKYRPAYFSGFDKTEHIFNTMKELLNIDWVKEITEYEDLHRLSIAIDEDNNQHKLMAEFREGYDWYVVGFIYGHDITPISDMPIWKEKYKNGATKRQ